jgi:glutamate-ammonia-ligase adenylyltransferase
VVGSAAARAALNDVIGGVLAGGRPARELVADARGMRTDMAAHKPPSGPLDAKMLPGGLVDLEFTVHVVQLVNRTGFDPELGRALDALIGEGLIAPTLRRAHDLLTRLLVALRLLAPDGRVDAPASRSVIAAAVGAAGWDEMIAQLAATRHDVEAEWARVSGGNGGPSDVDTDRDGDAG